MGRSWKVNINPRAKDVLNGSAPRGLLLAAEHGLGESNKRVPHEEGTLERSGAASVDPAKLVAAVSYDTPYAVRQHEDMALHHNDGREAKFLENALNAETTTMAKIIADTIRGEF